MKLKLILLAAICAFMPAAEAATVGCPVNFPDEGGIIVGLEINEFKNYRFYDKDAFAAAPVDFGSSQYIAKIQYGVNNWAAVTAKAGSADLRMSDPEHSQSPAPGMDFSKGEIYGAGARLVVYEHPERAMRLVFSSEYMAGRPGDVIHNGSEFSAKWKEWDNALFMVFSKQNVIPEELFTGTSFYIGGKHSRPQVELTGRAAEDEPKETSTLEADDNIIFFAGFDIVLDKSTILSAEARIGNIDSYTLAFAYRF